ncbi:Hypothetical Protein FCC1311_074362 [Hondaea fermentalgiana]|uniref:BSD domain-containing protein n=1 Tax=Hondaea fermentalgiana TaxID=2315210 RepID=A0A2R5GKQ3_9STRA|nr:Hypothetical Protein FCC1311_074362 [Hondaea fermentalgiana]|eukprot:GBG31215.1 Hypothetical Protein FCC1311_074362 [Hondaea fermentalgiana]
MFSGLLNQYKRELNEFVETVREDTSQVLSSAAEKLSKLNVDGDDSDEDKGAHAAAASLKLARIPDFETFLEVDLEHGDQLAPFEDFASSFQLSSREDQIKAAGDALLDLYDAYVPDRMTHESFWMRYFYFQHVQRRARLLAGDMGQQDEELSWGDDDEEEDLEDDDEDQEDQDRAAGDSSNTKSSANDVDDDAASADARAGPTRSSSKKDGRGSALAGAKVRAAMAEQTVEDLRTQVERLTARVAELERENESLRREQERASTAEPMATEAAPAVPAEDVEDRVQMDEIEQMQKEDVASSKPKADDEEDDSDLGVWEVDDSVVDGGSSSTTEPPVLSDDNAAENKDEIQEEEQEEVFDDEAGETAAEDASKQEDTQDGAKEEHEEAGDEEEEDGWGSWE